MDTARFLIILVLLLIGVIILFAVSDRLLKGSSKKNEKKTNEIEPPKENPKQDLPNKEQDVRTMKIYNSELADDLNALIEKSNQETSSRLKIEKYEDKEGNISKYIKRKNYQEFDFGSANENEEQGEDADSISFTVDDYKRIMALSNIDDKK